MLDISSTEFTSPENLRMRPCGVIASFANIVEQTTPGVSLYLSNSNKKKTAKAISIIGLSLLGINKNDRFRLEIQGGNSEQIEKIITSFKELITTKLGDPALHDKKGEPTIPSGIQLRSKDEKRPEYDKFQERYNFLIRVQQFLEENKNYFCRPEVLTYDEYEHIRKLVIDLRKEEFSMENRHNMSLVYGEVIGYLCRDNPHREPRNTEYEDVLKYDIPASILETQSYLGALPKELIQAIDHNIGVLLSLQKQLDDLHDLQSIKDMIDDKRSSMIRTEDRDTDISIYFGHSCINALSGYHENSQENGSNESLGKIKQEIKKIIIESIAYAQDFV